MNGQVSLTLLKKKQTNNLGEKTYVYFQRSRQSIQLQNAYFLIPILKQTREYLT